MERKPWWKKKRAWALLLGVAGTACSFIPAANIAAAPLLKFAGILGFKGILDAQDRTENIANSNAKTLSLRKDG